MAKKKQCIWYVCDNCGEKFAENHKRCPKCNKGSTTKTCTTCGCEFAECKCSV